MRAKNTGRVVTQRAVTVTRPMPKTGSGARPGLRENIAERQARAIALRKQGATYRSIGATLGVSQVQALRDVMAALGEVVLERQEDARQLLALELERLDWLLLQMTPRAQRGDSRAAMVMLRVSERRSRLLGLDAPEKHQLWSGDGSPLRIDATLVGLSNADLLARLDTMRAQLAALPTHDGDGDALPPGKVPPDDNDELSPAARAYARELAARNANGNGA